VKFSSASYYTNTNTNTHTHTQRVYHFDRYLANYDRSSRCTHVCMSSYKVIDDTVSANKKVQ